MPKRLGVVSAMFVLAAFAGASPGGAAQGLFAEKGCAGCHGQDGRQSLDAVPRLAGQNADYLFRQMKDVADGRRVAGHGPDGEPRTKAMKDTMSGVAESDLRAMASWLATVPPPAPMSGDAAAAAEGADLYLEFGCMGCHGPDGVRPLAGYPVLAGQNPEYLTLQIKEIRDVVRTNGRARVMVEFVHNVDNTQAERIAAYLSQAGRTAPSP